MGRLHRVGEIATLTGVSIRTLHHYDRIGLLRPSARTAAGYRLYGEDDVLRLQQVLTLRYLGFDLRRIGALLDRPDFDLVASLRIQRAAVRERIAELERIETALDRVIERRLATGEWARDLVVGAAEVVAPGPARGGDEMDELYTPEQMERFAELGRTVPTEEIEAIQDGWTALLADVRAAADFDPADPRSWDLADRWDALTERTSAHYRAHPELMDAIRANYDRGAFAGSERAPQAADFAFVERIKAARTGAA